MATFDPKVKDALKTMEKTIEVDRKSQEFGPCHEGLWKGQGAANLKKRV